MKDFKLRKTLSLLLCAVLLMGFFPATAFAAEDAAQSPAVPRLTGSGKISLTLTGFTVEEKEYDGSDKVRLVDASLKGLPAGYECPSSINLTGSLESADVGTHRLVSIDEQYISILDADGNDAIGQFNIEFDTNISGTIKPREVTLVGYTAEKTYDGSADVVLDLTNARLDGLPADFTAMLPETISGTLTSADAGTHPLSTAMTSMITIVGGSSDAGTNNFEISVDRNVLCTVKPIVVHCDNITASKVYDGDTHVSGTVSGPFETGSDDIRFEYFSNFEADFDTPDAGENKTFAVTYTTVYYKGVSVNRENIRLTGTGSISPRDISKCSVSLSEDSVSYTGSAPVLNVVAVDNSVGSTPLTEGVDYELGSLEKDVGEHTVTVSGIGNYTGSVELSYSISKSTSSISFSDSFNPDWTYFGKEFDNPAPGYVNIRGASYNDVSFIWYKDGKEISGRPVDAGSYYVVAKIPESSNTSASEAQSAPITVKPRTVNTPTITLEESRYYYDGTEKTPAVTVINAGLTIPASEYTVSYSNNVNAGTATVTIADKDGDNYIVNGSATFEITKASITVSAPTAKDLMHSHIAQELVNAGSITHGPANAQFEYAVSASANVSPDSLSWGSGIPKEKFAGTYYVWYRVTTEDANYSQYICQLPIEVHISKAEYRLYKEPNAVENPVYNGSDIVLISSHGLLLCVDSSVLRTQYALSDSPDTKPALASFSYDRPAATNAGTYYVWYGNVSDSYYEPYISETPLTVTIAPLPIEITVDQSSKYYTDADPDDFSFTVEPFVSLALEISREAGENVGEYDFILETELTNYEASFTNSFVIERKPIYNIAYSIVLYNGEYTGEEIDGLEFFEFEGGLVEGTDYTVSGNIRTAVGTHTVTFTGIGNYCDEQTVSFEILPPSVIRDVLDDTITAANVTLDRLDELKLLEEALSTINEDTVHDDLEEWKNAAEKLPAIIDALEELDALVNSEDIKAAEDINADNVTMDDKQSLEDAKADIEKLLDEYSGNLGAETVEELEQRLETIEDSLDALKAVEDTVTRIEKWLNDNEKKFDADELKLREEYQDIMDDIDALDENSQRIAEAALGERLKAAKAKLYTYKIVSGDYFWVRNSGVTMDFIANGHIDLFEYLLIDGKELDEANYTLSSGSTIVKLKAEYMQKLEPGRHSIRFVYTDGSTGAKEFIVGYTANGTVATGDSNDPALWLALMFMSLAAVTAALPRLRRREDNY